LRPRFIKGHEEEVISVCQRLVDGALTVLAHWLACRLYGDAWTYQMTSATALAVFVFGIVGELAGLYAPWRSERLRRELFTVLAVWMTVLGSVILLAFATKTSGFYSRVVSFGWFLLAPALLCIGRIGWRTALRYARARGRNIKRVAVLGYTPNSEAVYQRILERPWLGMEIIGVYEDRSPDRRHAMQVPSARFAGGVEDLVRDCRSGLIDIVYIGLPLRAELRISQIVRELADTTVTVNLAADFFTFDLLNARWSQLGNVPIVSIYDTPFRGIAGGLKRLEDIVLGSMIVALIALPLLVIAVLVKLTSKGPVFFRQRRYGLNGKEIRVLKFRTMTVCEDGDRIKQATKDDARITPLGRILRRTSIDELPQFLQVLSGKMSIVGPRPHAVAHNEQYRALIHGYMLRHKVKPGITGWAQVNGWRGETPELYKMAKRVQHDLDYIQNWNLFWDLKIIVLTAIGSKKGRNAY
jgi:putative colanic acid biosynthesis UDP-glucose lipid carrier transferase